jgi:hypothetical protein
MSFQKYTEQARLMQWDLDPEVASFATSTYNLALALSSIALSGLGVSALQLGTEITPVSSIDVIANVGLIVPDNGVIFIDDPLALQKTARNSINFIYQKIIYYYKLQYT